MLLITLQNTSDNPLGSVANTVMFKIGQGADIFIELNPDAEEGEYVIGAKNILKPHQQGIKQHSEAAQLL